MNKIRNVIIIAFLLSIHSSISQNVLKNSGFENKDGWNYWGGEVVNKPHSGAQSLLVENVTQKWSGADQIIYLDKSVKRVQISGWISTVGVVKGSKSWEMARISVEFLNASNNRVGDYLPVVGEVEGSSDYNFFQKEYSKPQNASRLKVMVGLANCLGTAYFDDLSVILYADSNKVVGQIELTGPKDFGAWYKMKTFPDFNGSHYVDWSSLLDAPAGKHGFVKTENDHLVFEDGVRVKFWGTNLVAGDCFPTKNDADSLALRLSKMGCNMVRLHHMDAPWAKPNIFGNGSNTLSLSSESLDRLDYLIFTLKQKGIYIYLDLLVHRDFTVNDGVINRPPEKGAKQVGFFSPELIKLQKKYISQLLTHKNPYTSLKYINDPVIAGSEFINESSIFMHFGGDILTDQYREELQSLFKKSGYKGKTLAKFSYDWNSNHTIQAKNDSGDVRQTILFLTKMERDYFNELTNHMRSIGVKYPLSGSNFPPPILAYQKDNSMNDIVLTNAYWDHPQLWKIDNDWSKVLWAPLDNNSMIQSPKKSIIHQQSKHQWCNKPFIVTEYNIAYPNEFNLEGVPFTAAYGSLQGFDGLLQFHSKLDAIGKDRIRNFTTTSMPEHVASWVIAAPMFLRGDIKEGMGTYVDQVSTSELENLPLYSDYLDHNSELPYISKVVKCDSTKKKVPVPERNIDKASSIYSDTEELNLKPEEGLFLFNSSRTCGVVGNLKGNENSLKWFDVVSSNPWASVMLVSATDKSIEGSEKLYLVVVTPTKMKGDEFNSSRNGMAVLGEGPIMAQVFEGKVTLKLSADKKIKVFEKNLDGSRGKEIEVSTSKNRFVLNLSQGRSFVYEVVIE